LSRPLVRFTLLLTVTLLLPAGLAGQGVTTAAIHGVVSDTTGTPLTDANVLAVHIPSGTQYRGVTRSGGAYSIPNMRVGGPYRISVRAIGFEPKDQDEVFLNLAQNLRLDYQLVRQAVQLTELTVTGERDEVLNAGRTGAATFLKRDQVTQMPSIKRSTVDLTRIDPRSDGNFSFAGRNWLYNNISVDGSYFNNPYGLDNPSPGGQTKAQPIPFDAVDQVQVSVAPFDIRQGGFTGANVNTVTKSGTNDFRTSIYSFYRSDELQGNEVSGLPVAANPDLNFIQSGISLSGPLIRDKLFFYANFEMERTDDPGTNFVASRPGITGFGVSRVEASVMDAIRQRLIDEYDYDPGPYEGYIHETDNNKFLLKLDWNPSQSNHLSLRYNLLDASRDLPPHPFVFSVNNTGRGPNESSLPFYNSGYAINNNLNSFALELNTNKTSYSNRFFASFNRFRDSRTPFSRDFPTLEIGEDGITYTTAGHEPFSIHNILDQNVWQFTNNLTLPRGRHTFTMGANYESFSFFNSFNLFRHGLFQVPYFVTDLRGGTFNSVQEFMDATDPNNPSQLDLNGYVATGPFKGEKISTAQLSFYAQDEFLTSDRFTLTYGLRADIPMYYTDPVDNQFSRDLEALDENDQPEIVDQSNLPGAKLMLSPRVGFNWNVSGDRQTQIRGGSGVFTGRIPFVWFGNVISNPGANPNLPPTPGAPEIPTSDDAILQQSFDLNAMDPEFKWPQIWTTDLAVDKSLFWDMLGTLEVIYSKDLNAIFMRNADLVTPVRNLPDGRPYYGGTGANELTSDFGAGMYVLDNTSEGHSLNITAQLRKIWTSGASAMLAYNYIQAKNNLKTSEIASVLWQSQPVQGDPNRPELSYAEFGPRHRIVGAATFAKTWSQSLRTSFGVFLEIAEGNQFDVQGGNRYSFLYAGDVNGDGYANDLIYIPRDQSEIILVDTLGAGTPAEQWERLNNFIEQDAYLRGHRGQIAERAGAVNPWYHNLDLRILQDLGFGSGNNRHTFQLSLDLLNLTNLINSDWGVRKSATPAAISPLRLLDFNNPAGAPRFVYTGPTETFSPDPGELSRWRAQVGLRYFFQ
jgi:hypothetical protein